MIVAAVILAIGVPAIVIDYRSRRIPNLLVIAGLAAAFLVHGLDRGAAGLAAATLGGALGLVCLLPLHLTGAMGAGDVKLMAAMGALLGPSGAFEAAVMALVAGGAIAVATLGWRRFAELETTVEPGASGGALRALAVHMPYAGAIVAGALVAAFHGPTA